MAEQSTHAAPAIVTAAPRPRRGAINLKKQHGFAPMAAFCLLLLYAPIMVLVFFSFNETRSVSQWAGFSWKWYGDAFANKDIQDAALISLQIAAFATIVGTSCATMAALATTRTRPWRGMTSSYMLINMPLMVPEIVTAIATLIFFGFMYDVVGWTPGIFKLMIAHTVFCIPFAYLPIRARLEDMDKTLEQAAADLYASRWQTFRRVTLPLMTPGIVAGATLAFVISFDDFTITLLVAGPGETTLPIYIWTSLRRGISPEINAMSSILLVISIILVTASFILGRRRK